MNSPIDGAPMRQIHRFGIEFDVCPATGGVWLDKGELEKLIALVKEDAHEERGGNRGRDEHFSSDDDDGHDRGRRRPGGGRRSRLSDIFDF
jgi:Zn-finger nucleic acid-binding protein